MFYDDFTWLHLKQSNIVMCRVDWLVFRQFFTSMRPSSSACRKILLVSSYTVASLSVPVLSRRRILEENPDICLKHSFIRKRENADQECKSNAKGTMDTGVGCFCKMNTRTSGSDKKCKMY